MVWTVQEFISGQIENSYALRSSRLATKYDECLFSTGVNQQVCLVLGNQCALNRGTTSKQQLFEDNNFTTYFATWRDDSFDGGNCHCIPVERVGR